MKTLTIPLTVVLESIKQEFNTKLIKTVVVGHYTGPLFEITLGLSGIQIINR